jgi:hypothetical protein
MQLDAYRTFTAVLLQRASAHTTVVGLVALGSMAEVDYGPDEGSDHDFFLVVQPGTEESFRARLDWLPRPADVRFHFRETAHGLKVLYADPHLIEFAVFNPDDLAVARVNRFRVLLDRADISVRMAAVAAATQAMQPPGDRWLLGQVLGELWVTLGRDRRGEHLSARQRLVHAVGHLAQLLARHLPANERERLDALDPLRRFEQVYPALGSEIGTLLAAPAAEAARGVLALTERELAARLDDFPSALVAALRNA